MGDATRPLLTQRRMSVNAENRGRGKIVPFVVGLLIGLLGGVWLVWLGIVPPLDREGTPTKAVPPAAEPAKTTPEKTETVDEAGTEASTGGAQPQAELQCLQRKAVAAVGSGTVQLKLQWERAKGAPDPASDPDYYVRLLRGYGLSCSDAEIAATAD